VYPLLDTESTTEPVPIYQPETEPKPGERKTEPSQKKRWWPF
jgi:hypothetical protein